MLKGNSDKNPYDLWKGRLENVKCFRVFGIKCYIKREDSGIGKFDSRVDKGIFVEETLVGFDHFLDFDWMVEDGAPRQR
jgi:hypothetical protein